MEKKEKFLTFTITLESGNIINSPQATNDPEQHFRLSLEIYKLV